MFKKIENQNLILSLRQLIFINSFPVKNHLSCISKCSKSNLCTIAIIDSSNCSIYIRNYLNESNLIYSPTSTIYLKTSYHINQYLIHYWPFNGDYRNLIANTNLDQTSGLNFELVTDRFGRSNSSLYLNNGYLRAPDDVYIYGDFTLTSWVKMNKLAFSRTFFTFSTPSGNKIYFCLTSNMLFNPYFGINNAKQIANTELTLGQWQHLAYTIKGSTLSIYLDGILVYDDMTTPISLENNIDVYFGFGTKPQVQLDDVKIFSRSLTQSEIIESLLEQNRKKD